MKRTVSIFLTVIMLFGLTSFAGPASAATEYSYGDFTYTVSGSNATITAYPETARGAVDIPTKFNTYTVTAIAAYAFYGCTLITEVKIPNTVKSIGNYAFAYCTTLTSVEIPSSVTSIGTNTFKNSNKVTIACEAGSYAETYAKGKGIEYRNVELSYTAEHVVTYNYSRNGGTSATKTKETVSEGKAIDLTPTAQKDGWVFVGWNTDYSKTTALSSLKMGTKDVTLYAIFKNIYNRGEESYSFENYGDEHSDGHCFGMAATSSGYYLGNLNKSIIGGTKDSALYSFHDTSKVRQPICHYFEIQGEGPEYDSIVAGGSLDLHGKMNVRSDWNACVNYVKGHGHDNTGDLNVGMWYYDGGGHAVNFLYYKEVGGQQRLYVYDNNFPEIETYYYMGSDGFIYQAPEQTGGAIMGMDLMDVDNYFKLAPTFKKSSYVYAEKDKIVVEGAKVYPMKCGPQNSSFVMYKIPESAETVTIIPLEKNSHFTYCDKVYSFNNVDENTRGELTVSTSETSSDATFVIENAPDLETSFSGCPWCGQEHVGFFAGIIAWFHGILAMIFGARY